MHGNDILNLINSFELQREDVMTAATSIDLIINQKADFTATLTVKENNSIKDLSGFSVLAEYKQDFTSPDSSAKSFTASISNSAAGEISLSLTYEQTANLQVNQRYYYDVVLISDSTNFRTRVAEGTIRVSPGVSI